MTFDEWRILVKGLKSVYTSPNFLPDGDSIKIWYNLLQDIPYNVASAAIQKYMMTEKFPPTVADIRDMVANVKMGDKPLWSDGWEEVLIAIRKYGSYRENEAMESMSELTRMAVQRLGFRNICMSENIMTDRANFRMIFEQLAERNHTQMKIPMKLATMIEQIRGNLMLEENKRE